MKSWLRFPPPLHVLALLIMLGLSAISLVFKVTVLDRLKVDRFLAIQKKNAMAQVEKLAAFANSDTPGSMRILANQITAMRIYPALRWAAVCDAQGKILNCTRAEWEGKLLSDVAPHAASLMDQVATTRDPSHFVNGHDSLLAAKPLPGSDEVPLKTVTLAERDIADRINQVLRDAKQDTLMSAATMLGYSLLLSLVMYFFVKWRLRDFYEITGLDHARSVPLRDMPGGDEFADIARVLGKAEHLLQDIADNLQEIVWIVSPTLRAVYLSPAFEKIYMRKRAEAYVNVGAMPDYILKEYHDPVRDAFLAVVKGAPSVNLEYRIQRGDGQIRWIEARGFPVRDASGALQRIVGISRDVTEQKALQEELVNVSEQERHSLGHDLHDDACQRLAAMKMKSEALTTRLKMEQSPNSALAAELTTQISGTSALLRNIARGLAPVEVAGDGLMYALEKLVLMQETIHEIPCFFDAEHTVIVTNEIIATHLYRIAQEFITNAARHGKPERIDVQIVSEGSLIRLTVTNDGVPFKPPPPEHPGMGLKIIRYRASAIGATIEIRPRTDGVTGTFAECTLSQDTCLSAGPPKRNGTSTEAPEDPQI